MPTEAPARARAFWFRTATFRNIKHYTSEQASESIAEHASETSSAEQASESVEEHASEASSAEQANE